MNSRRMECGRLERGALINGIRGNALDLDGWARRTGVISTALLSQRPGLANDRTAVNGGGPSPPPEAVSPVLGLISTTISRGDGSRRRHPARVLSPSGRHAWRLTVASRHDRSHLFDGKHAGVSGWKATAAFRPRGSK